MDTQHDIIHLGSRSHERWSVQREVFAVTSKEISTEEGTSLGLFGKCVMCWHYDFWKNIPENRRVGCRVVCLFHHHLVERFDDPQIVGAMCLNSRMFAALRSRQPAKWTARVHTGGAEDAIPYARRSYATPKIRLLVAGNGHASVPLMQSMRGPSGTVTSARKGTDMILPLAQRLNPERYAWVFVGPGWSCYGHALNKIGFTVIQPGTLPDPEHYRYFGEGDIYLLLSRQEGVPLTLLETMGLGIWPISTQVGIAPEIIIHGHNGYLVAPPTNESSERFLDVVADQISSLTSEMLAHSRKTIVASVSDFKWTRFKMQVDQFLSFVFNGL
ncbi:MAG: glycosyltransferase [Verrucomicrobia bacterium]|jgi:glycosyltransferase involved in cell wall biosynthesis|nr:glycosyltransferase [Verrucomicrobiota bacterium]